MTDTTKILPKLRFPEFKNDGEWKVMKFKDIFTMLSNNTLSRAELSEQDGIALNIHYGDVLIKFGERLDLNNDNLPHIKDDEILHKYKSSYLKDGDVIFADTAEDETAGKCTEIRNIGKQIVISGLHTIPCRPKNEFAPYYLGYYLNSNAYHTKLLPLMQGAKVTSISRSSLQETTVVYPPSLPEQQKIAAFLTLLDEQISAHTKKLEALKAHKKGLMQQLFPANGEKTPKLRFPEFKNAGEWKEVRLGEIAERRKEKVGSKLLEPISVSAGIGIVSQKQKFGKDISGNQYKNYIHIQSGDYVYNKGYSKTFPQGSIYELTDFAEAAAPNAFICFRFKNNFCPQFFNGYFEQNSHGKQLVKYITSGARGDGLLNLNPDNFFKIKFLIPSFPEQQKIASFLSSIDEIIQAQDDKIQKLKTYKNGLMQQMFPSVETPYYDVSTVID